MTAFDSVAATQRFDGVYAATVFNNVDPEQRGRLLLKIPDVLGNVPSTWAQPCLPLSGPTGPTMGAYFVPLPETGVWVMFQHGDVNRPVWIGCRIGSTADVPPMALAAPPTLPPLLLQSITQDKLIISNAPGEGITLETSRGPAGPSIKMTALGGIIISDGEGGIITIFKGVVTINGGALVIK